MGLREEDRGICIRAIESFYPDHCVKELEDQGYCSFTLAVTPLDLRLNRAEDTKKIVQIRPKQHSLDSGIATAARKTYGSLVPKIQQLTCILPGGLLAVEMTRLPGVPLSKIAIQNGTPEQQTTLIQSFAKFIAKSWPTTPNKDNNIRCAPLIPSPSPTTLSLIVLPSRRTRADSPTDTHWIEQHCTGPVGRVLIPKLRTLEAHLPDEDLRVRAKETLSRLLSVQDFPVVLNHGDLIPSNVLVDSESWAVTGLVDWAEAEWLPFGTCVYGVEHLLGRMERVGRGERVWKYFEGSKGMRKVFWDAVVKESPGLEGRWEELECMRDVGVLLWYGFAWDEGKIDRVVNETVSCRFVISFREVY